MWLIDGASDEDDDALEAPTEAAELEASLSRFKVRLQGPGAPQMFVRHLLPTVLVVAGIVVPTLFVLKDKSLWLALVALALCWGGAILVGRVRAIRAKARVGVRSGTRRPVGSRPPR